MAALQNHLYAARQITSIEMAPYLSRLCQALAESMIGDSRPVLLKVEVAGGRLPSGQAGSVGLLVTEPVINALKHVFPAVTWAARVGVAYEAAGTNWKLSTSDNGIGCRTRMADASGRRNRALAGRDSDDAWRGSSGPRHIGRAPFRIPELPGRPSSHLCLSGTNTSFKG